jgi:hypothetical protein
MLAQHQRGSLPGLSQRGRGLVGTTAPRPLRASARRQLRPQCSVHPSSGDRAGSSSSNSGNSGESHGPSSSGSAGGDNQQQQNAHQQHLLRRGWRTRVGAIGAGMAGSWAIAFPGLGGGNGGGAGGNGGGGGGGGGGWWGGSGGHAGNPAFDLAAEEDKGAKKKKKKGKEQQPAEEDPEVAAVEALLEEADAETEAPAAATTARRAADELITSETELDEMVRDAGREGDGQRHGTRRCVEVVVEGWPEVGALPKEVSRGFICEEGEGGGGGACWVLVTGLEIGPGGSRAGGSRLPAARAGLLYATALFYLAHPSPRRCPLPSPPPSPSSRTCSPSRRGSSLTTRTSWTTGGSWSCECNHIRRDLARYAPELFHHHGRRPQGIAPNLCLCRPPPTN